MNILVISNYSGENLQPIRPEVEIFRGLRKKGYQIHVITPCNGHYPPILEEEGFQLHDYRPTGKIDWRAIKLIKSIVKNNDIQIVHAFHSKAISNAAFALIGLPVKLVTYRGYTGNIHWYDPSLYLTFLNPRIDYMVCLAESVRERYLGNGVNASRAVTIHKGHSPSWYDGVKKMDLSVFGIPSGAITFSFVANHRVKMKGIKYLVEATYQLPLGLEFYILMIGRGLDPPEIKQLIEKSPYKDRFIFTGFLETPLEVVKSCDASISVSIFGEATQKAMIEAIYLGNPVIISDIPGNKGMAIDNETGFIVEPKNSAQIKDAIQNILARKSELDEMGSAGKKHLQQFLSVDKTVEAYDQFYRRILE